VYSTFTYSVEGPVPPAGTRVLVPFRREERIGWIVGAGSGAGLTRVRPILDILEGEPSVPPELLELSGWIADYYLAPLGMVLRTSLPSALSDSSRDYLTLVGKADDVGTPRERKLLAALGQGGTPRRVSTLRKALAMGSIWPEIRALATRGRICHQTVPPRDPPVRTHRVVRVRNWLSDLSDRENMFRRASRQREAYEALESSGGSAELAHLLHQGGFSRSVIRGLEDKGVVVLEDVEVLRDPFREEIRAEPKKLVPTRDQAAVLAALGEMLQEPNPPPALLHGVTGSGKTLVYIELLKEVVHNRNQGAIVLVPEIALTPQTVSRFRAHFGDDVAVLHSALSEGERFDAWRQLREGKKRIAVGARSAVFAPIPRLGAIVVDEEHDGSYKQSEGPRYQARDVAIVRAARAGALCLLGSATPSLESWQNAQIGKFRLFSLLNRVGGGALPPVRVIDLKRLWRGQGTEGGGQKQGPGRGVLSPELVEGIGDRLRRGEQVMLLLNRRGYSNFVQCRGCGEVWQCLRCSVSLTFHRVTGRLLCHHCRHEEPPPKRCPRCGSEDLSFKGLGTEQVERVVTEAFPGARIARMDVDTTSGKWSHHEILGRFGRGEVDILLGTQMISKGLDFPRVTLVGVVNADVGIHLPDFRASERTFQLLSQVAGRTGRSALGGEVLVQTSLPEHFAVKAALSHDFVAFATRELQERKTPPYPPHTRLANVLVSSPTAEEAAREAERSASWFRAALSRYGKGIEVVGPAPAPIEKLHGRWRWHFLLRASSPAALSGILRDYLGAHRPRGKDVRVVLDRDPVALL
ncbi:MAG: primosomal protein N', partial [Longimicrobiales bacterium]|nr:primosomal protein N' [Longimicrobiales bacterium]